MMEKGSLVLTSTRFALTALLNGRKPLRSWPEHEFCKWPDGRPLLIVNALFIRLLAAITTSYSLGWLAKLVVAATAVALLLR